MPSSRSSDSFSDVGSLSDLESSWTDISSNRSGRPFRSRSATDSDTPDSEDDEHGPARPWETAITTDDDDGDNDFIVDGESTVAVQPPSPLLEDPLVHPEASLSSLQASTNTLRLAFPDPLSDSTEHLLPSRRLVQQEPESPAQEDTSTARLPDPGLSKEELPLPLGTGNDHSFTIVLAGHPPLPHLKLSVIYATIKALGHVFQGTPQMPPDVESASMINIPIYNDVKEKFEHGAPSDVVSVLDRTTGSIMVR